MKKSMEELMKIGADMKEKLGIRDEKNANGTITKRHVLVCGGTGCTSSGSAKIIDKLHEEIKKNGIEDKVEVVRTGCFGLCALGPIMIVYPEGSFYSMVKEEEIEEIVAEHLKNGNIVKKYLYKETVMEDGSIKSLHETNFYKKQHRVALRNCGNIDPENIDEYRLQGPGKSPQGNVPRRSYPDYP